MKILLFSSPSEMSKYSLNYEFPIYPLGLAYLGSVLEQHNYEVKVFDFFHDTWEKAKKIISQIIIKEKPDVIGISSMTMNRISSFKFSKIAKKINPNVKILMGGIHSTIMYEQILKNFPVDYIVLGEAEETIIELMDAIKKKKDKRFLKNIKGIAYRDENEIVNTGKRPFINNLDLIPFPKHSYFKKKILRSNKVYLMTSRGCPFGCQFCSTSNYWGRLRRERSVNNIIAEIKQIQKEFPNVQEIFFADDEFTLNQKKTIEFCKRLIDEKINLKWACSARVTSVSEELAYWMKKANCVKIALGVESGSPELIEVIHKRITNKQIINAFRIFYNAGINTDMFLIVGIPGENSKTINQTIKLLKKLAKYKPHVTKPSLLQVYPYTELYEIVKKQGIINDNFWLKDELTPVYTYEHSRNRLLYWSIKVVLSYKLARGELLKYCFKALKNLGVVKRIFLTGE